MIIEYRQVDIQAVYPNAGKPKATVTISSHLKSKSELFIKISDQAKELIVYDVSLETDEEL